MKNIRKILIGLIILNIILLILQLIIFKYNKNEINDAIKNEPITVKEENKLYPAGSFKFTYLYNGNAEIDLFYNKINDFVTYIEKLYKDTKNLSDKDLNLYYNKNINEIKKVTGINTIKQFSNLCNQISKCNVNEKYQKVEMKNETYKNNENDCSIQINIIYNNGKMVEVIASFSKDKYAEDIAKFIPVEKE